MRFYVGARTGPGQLTGNASTGMAELRRDGFAAVHRDPAAAAPRPALLTTVAIATVHPVLFVNAVGSGTGAADSAAGGGAGLELLFAVLDAETKQPLPGLAATDCLGTAQRDGERMEVRWAGGVAVMRQVLGRDVRLQVSRIALTSRALDLSCGHCHSCPMHTQYAYGGNGVAP